MKKHAKLLLFGAGLLLGSLAIASANVKNYEQADGMVHSAKIVRDRFNTTQYKLSYDSTQWDRSGSNIKQTETNESFLRTTGSNCDGDHIFFGTKEVIQNLQSFQIDLRYTGGTFNDASNNLTSRWYGLKFLKTPITAQSYPSRGSDIMYQAPLMFYYNRVQVLGSGVTYTGSGSFSNLIGVDNVADVWISMKFVPITATQAKVYFKLAGDANFNESKYLTINTTNANYDFLNGQFGIQTENKDCTLDIDNIIIQSTNINLEDHFEDFDEEDDDNPLMNLRNTKYGVPPSDGYAVYGNSCLSLQGSSMGESLVAKIAIKEDKTVVSSVEVLKAEFSVKIPSTASTNERIAFAFGLPTSQSYISQAGGYIAFDRSQFSINIAKPNGDIIKSEYASSSLFGITSYEGASIVVTINKNGIVSVYADGDLAIQVAADAEVKVSRYAGYLGFFALGTITSEVLVDDAIVTNSSYFVPHTKSVTHNFSNNYFGNKGYEDFYLPDQHSGSIEVVDGKLKYAGCADDCFFGSNYQYDAFILEYKLCSIYVGTPDMSNDQHTGPGRWIGIDLSREKQNIRQYGTYATITVNIVATNPDAEFIDIGIWQQDDHDPDFDVWHDVKKTIHNKVPYKLFKDIQYDGVGKNSTDILESDYVCFRWESDGSSISLSFKKNGETEYTKYVTYSNLELNGYFALCNTGYFYGEYDDFSMANTSPIYTCADNEPPEVIVETETVKIYDNSNPDVNLDKEIELNKVVVEVAGGCKGSIIASSALICLFSLTGVSILLTRRKGDKNEK